jgi:hypothetical protein
MAAGGGELWVAQTLMRIVLVLLRTKYVVLMTSDDLSWTMIGPPAADAVCV